MISAGARPDLPILSLEVWLQWLSVAIEMDLSASFFFLKRLKKKYFEIRALLHFVYLLKEMYTSCKLSLFFLQTFTTANVMQEKKNQKNKMLKMKEK